jgi:hypothetical protein
MAEFLQLESSQLVAPGQNVLFLDSIRCPNGYVLHDNGSGVFTLRGITRGCNQFARFQVTFVGNIAIPTGGTVAAIAAALALNGEELQFSRAIVTPTAVEQFFNVTCTRTITVAKGCCPTLSIRNVNAGVGEDIDQQAILFADGNLVIDRTA